VFAECTKDQPDNPVGERWTHNTAFDLSLSGRGRAKNTKTALKVKAQGQM